MDKLAKIIRILSVAPFMALISLTLIFFVSPTVYNSPWDYAIAVFALTVFPLLAYPIQPLIPGFKGKGREGQRNLAILMAVAGYLFGIVTSVFMMASKKLLILYMTYLISGIGIVIFNKLLHIRASGHACGVAGPVIALVYYIGPYALFGVLFLPLVYWACIRMKRHTFSQLICGSLISVISFFLSLFFLSI